MSGHADEFRRRAIDATDAEILRLVAGIKAALEGDSNDAEHNALVGVAQFFGVEYNHDPYEEEAELDDTSVVVYASGLIAASVCYPASMPLDELTIHVNRKLGPTGLDHGWMPSEDRATFLDGQPNPCPCERDPGRLHRLYEC